ncbi:hypothetical protein HELRODRAFT_184080 [Helobdella robusta]|uniref:DUF7041 domain-containing protein n=1 Tax=Helobdella robusta TaxID=6412 RepID=T1FKJ4_HELRO|nr:hypothetical protein HELRODRAFT_184080 [Helobdella robusta]ESO08289.1 hypothetical protein HELRODRAFT_184080 [Helobdella robusta]
MSAKFDLCQEKKDIMKDKLVKCSSRLEKKKTGASDTTMPLRLNPFSTTLVEAWFIYFESVLRCRGISDKKVFHQLLLESLSLETIEEIEDEIVSATTYNVLKENLINKYSFSQKKSVEHLTKSTSAGSLNDSLHQLAAVVNQLHDCNNKKSRDAVPKLAEQICGRCERSLSHDEAVLRNICWYHKRFAENSKKCVPPCSYYSEAVATTSRKKSNRHLNHASASKERSKTSKQLEHDLRFVLDFITCRFLVVFNLYQ